MTKRISGFLGSLFDEQVFIRSIYAETLLENFFVAAVVSLFAIRLILRLTGYPTFGGESFHITHMLFGGFLMLIAFFILLSSLNHSSQELAAAIGGAGFGIFIDELGKFITNDNNYFYQPTIALIYVIFVIIYLAIRIINRHQILSPQEALANALEIAKQASLSDLDARDQQLILRLLGQSDPNDPFTQNLKDMLPRISTVPTRHAPVITRVKQIVDNGYQAVTARWWFTGAIIAFFILSSGITLYSIIALIDWSWLLLIWIITGIIILFTLLNQWRNRAALLQVIVAMAIIGVAIFVAFVVMDNLKATPVSFIDFAPFISSSTSAILVVIGILRIYRFRLGAYYMFRRAILVSILLTRVFSFYDYQFAALAGLAWDIMVLLALRYMIRQEEIRLGRGNNGRTGQPV